MVYFIEATCLEASLTFLSLPFFQRGDDSIFGGNGEDGMYRCELLFHPVIMVM